LRALSPELLEKKIKRIIIVDQNRGFQDRYRHGFRASWLEGAGSSCTGFRETSLYS
jgi:hypothetical protein